MAIAKLKLFVILLITNQFFIVEGNILVPGVLDQVDPVTDEERETYKNIDFDCEEFRGKFLKIL